MKILNLFFLFLLLHLTVKVNAQQYDNDQLKVALTKSFVENIKWPNEDKFDKFRIAVVNGSKSTISAFRVLAQSIKLKGKPVEIDELSQLPKKSNYQMVFCGKLELQMVEQIFQSLKKMNTLLITDQCTDQELVMVNYLESKQDGKTKFEINKANIIFAGLEVSPKMLLLGGTEVDVRELYKKSEAASAQLKGKLQLQEQELNRQKAEIEATKRELAQQKQELEKQKAEIVQQKDEIKKQNALITTQKSKLDELLANIAQKEALLNQKLAVLKTQEEAIKNKEELIAKQRKEEAKQKEILTKQLESITQQEDRIKDQKLVLLSMGAKIQFQKNLLTIFIVIFLIIAALLYNTVRNSRIRRRLNTKLEENQKIILSKNDILEKQAVELKLQSEELTCQSEELRSQAEELSAQADELNVTNESLRSIQEQTMASIRCAYSIQQAMLPMDKILNEKFSAFVYFSPKDVVSGDFFWYYVAPATETEPLKTYYAVVDCTGHGVPGAFMSLIGNRILNTIIAERGILDPAVILNLLDSEIKKTLKQDETENNDGMDAGICLIEELAGEQYKVTFSGAKHNLYLTTAESDGVKVVKGIRRSIGGTRVRKAPIPFADETLILHKKDRLYLFSDGIVDQANHIRKSYGIERLLDSVTQSKSMPLMQQKDHIVMRLEAFSQHEPQRDDITFVGIIL